MPPRANRVERSAAEQLLTTFGVRRHPDPFAYLTVDETSGSDWFQARIMGCLQRGVCPLCESQESGMSDYLFWLPANLRDADYFLSLYGGGGFCSIHLDVVMTYLRKFPYGQVRLLILERMLVEEGRFATKLSCHLCRTLEQSQQVYTDAFNDRLRSLEGTNESEALASRLCLRHAKALDSSVPLKRSKSEQETGALYDLGRQQKAVLVRALDEISSEFHRMSIHELRNKLDACESLLRKAIAPEV